MSQEDEALLDQLRKELEKLTITRFHYESDLSPASGHHALRSKAANRRAIEILDQQISAKKAEIVDIEEHRRNSL